MKKTIWATAVFWLGILGCQAEGVGGETCQASFATLALSTRWSQVHNQIDAKHCPVHYEVLKWAALYRADDTLSFHDYVEFIKHHQDWPWLQKIKENAEKHAASSSNPVVLTWFHQHPPKTADGARAYVDALKSLPESKRLPYLKKLWQTAVLSQETEKQLYASLKKALSPQDLGARGHFYLDKHQWRDAEKFLAWIPLPDQTKQSMMWRIQIQQGKIPKAKLMTHGGALLDALRYYRQQKSPQAVTIAVTHKQRLYAYASQDVWKEIHILIRRALEAQNYQQALDLIVGHQGLDDASWVDAIWLEGWLKAKVHKDFKKAQQCFQAMYTRVKTPISKAKAAFWVAEVLSYQNLRQAEEWFQKASVFPTTFYGQEALMRLKKPLIIPKDSVPSVGERRFFQERLLIKAALIFPGTPLEKELKTFLYMALKTSPSHHHSLLILSLAQKVIPQELVALAKVAAQTKEVYGPLAFPVLPKNLRQSIQGVDTDLVHAVIRKESGFDGRVVSPAGAMGLMQLMVGTAKMMAKKIDLSYSEDKLLSDKVFNIRLGCAYLQKNLENYNGNLILTLASYNAGPKPTADWITLFGDPRLSKTHPLTWIELIPYGETRNYIHRVIEAQRVYQSKFQSLER